MSFILDAIRKSDQQRQRSVAPTLMTAQVPAEAAKQSALLWYGLLAAALVGAGILIGWMQQGQFEPTAPALQTGIAKSHESPESRELAARTTAPAPLSALPVSADPPLPPHPAREAATATVNAPPLPVTATKPEPAQPAMPLAAVVVPAARDLAAPRQEARTAVVDAAANAGVPMQAELPPAIQQELPKLAILAHSYSSKPKARFVFINDQMVHEEEYPLPGLKLEQITPDGMIFSYKGYRFRRAANSPSN